MLIALAMAVGSIALTASVQLHNPRILASWHGLLHAAIANQFPGTLGTPENPFFAGHPLPYYWFYHFVTGILGRVLGLDPLHVFQLITAAGMIVLWIGGGAIGVRSFGSVQAGLLIGFLALAGVNPLGPAIAVGKYVLHGAELIDASPSTDSIETVFVSNREADALMTQPLLGALYVTTDWRRGQNLAWFFDNSSRGLALALSLPLLLVFMGALSRRRALMIGVIAAAMTALNPLIGLALAGSLFGGTVLVALRQRLRPGLGGKAETSAMLGLSGAALIGTLVAAPTYYHLFLVGGGGAAIPALSTMLLKATAVGTGFMILVPLAIWGCLRTTEVLRDRCWSIVIAAGALLLVIPVIFLPEGNEHNLANVAQCLLAVPAVAWTATRRVSRWTYMCLVGLFVPMTLATTASYLGRPSLPISFEDGLLHRPSDDALEHLYRWARASTPPRAVFVADPPRPVKMSGNVAELPAFTGRALFVDQPSYLTTPHPDFDRRTALATRLAEDIPPTPADAAYLQALERPIYLLSHRADQSERLSRLTQLYGPPLFHEGFVAVFDLAAQPTRTAASRPGR